MGPRIRRRMSGCVCVCSCVCVLIKIARTETQQHVLVHGCDYGYIDRCCMSFRWQNSCVCTRGAATVDRQTESDRGGEVHGAGQMHSHTYRLQAFEAVSLTPALYWGSPSTLQYRQLLLDYVSICLCSNFFALPTLFTLNYANLSQGTEKHRVLYI